MVSRGGGRGVTMVSGCRGSSTPSTIIDFQGSKFLLGRGGSSCLPYKTLTDGEIYILQEIAT